MDVKHNPNQQYDNAFTAAQLLSDADLVKFRDTAQGKARQAIQDEMNRRANINFLS